MWPHIRYVRDSFFAARSWRDIDDLNAQAQAWCEGIAAERPWPEDHSISVREAFERERGCLIALPGDRFPADERVEVTVDDADLVGLRAPVDSREVLKTFHGIPLSVSCPRAATMPSDPCTGAQGANSPLGVHHDQGPRHLSPPGAQSAGGARLLPIPWPAPSGMDGTRRMARRPVELNLPTGFPSALRAPAKPVGSQHCRGKGPGNDQATSSASSDRSTMRGTGGVPSSNGDPYRDQQPPLLSAYMSIMAATDRPIRSAAASISRSPRWA